jgi:hypothetical protein
MSQGCNFVYEDVGVFATDARPFITHEQLKANIKPLCCYAVSAQISRSGNFDGCSFLSSTKLLNGFGRLY